MTGKDAHTLPETALAFARECMDWKSAIIGNSPFAGIIGKGPLPGSEGFNFVDVNVVMDAARAWQRKNGLFMAMYFYPQIDAVMVAIFDDSIKVEAENANACHALMSACLEAARKLKAQRRASEPADEVMALEMTGAMW